MSSQGNFENVDSTTSLVQMGRRNLLALYAFTATSRLWFDGSLWLLYWQHKGISLFDVGILEAILHLVCLVVDVPIGIFADRFGWKLSLFGSAFFGVLYCSLALFGSTFLWAALAFAARGVQITLTNGADTAIAYESAKLAGLADKYQRISGRLMAIMLVAMAVAEASGGALAGWSWDSVYVAFALANVISMIAIAGLREPRASIQEPHTITHGTERSADLRGEEPHVALYDVQPHSVKDEGEQHKVEHDSAWTIAKDAVRFARESPIFLKWLLYSAMLSGFLATFSFYGQSLLLHNGWSLLGIGILSGVENGFGAAMALVSERVTKWLGEERTTMFTAMLGSLGLLLFAFIPGVASGIGYLTGSAAGNLADPLIDKELNQVIPSRQRATLLSANSTSFSLFMIVLFPLFGLAATHIGLIRAAEYGSLIGLVCIIVTAWILHYKGVSRVENIQ